MIFIILKLFSNSLKDYNGKENFRTSEAISGKKLSAKFKLKIFATNSANISAPLLPHFKQVFTPTNKHFTP
jgi:hypothetical protein